MKKRAKHFGKDDLTIQPSERDAAKIPQLQAISIVDSRPILVDRACRVDRRHGSGSCVQITSEMMW